MVICVSMLTVTGLSSAITLFVAAVAPTAIDAPASVIITDLTGRVVVKTMVDVDGYVPVGHLKQGTYLVKVNERVLKLIKK